MYNMLQYRGKLLAITCPIAIDQKSNTAPEPTRNGLVEKNLGNMHKVRDSNFIAANISK